MSNMDMLGMEPKDFSLDKARWYNLAGVERVAEWLCNDLAELEKYATALRTHHDNGPEVSDAMAKVSAALVDATTKIRALKGMAAE